MEAYPLLQSGKCSQIRIAGNIVADTFELVRGWKKGRREDDVFFSRASPLQKIPAQIPVPVFISSHLSVPLALFKWFFVMRVHLAYFVRPHLISFFLVLYFSLYFTSYLRSKLLFPRNRCQETKQPDSLLSPPTNWFSVLLR